MGTLIERPTASVIPLYAQHLIGVAPLCRLVVPHPRASSVHALLSWLEGAWQIKDLASTNGTFLDGARAQAGVWTRLWEGVSLGFGGPEGAYTLISAAPPEALAILQRHERVERIAGGLIPLPDGDQPEVIVLQDAQGDWVIERQAQVELAQDGQLVQTRGQTWRLSLPGAAHQTLRDAHGPTTLSSLVLRFDVSFDGDRVTLTLLFPDGAERRLEPRAHHALLLSLARRWAQDLASGAAPLDAGWVSMDDLARELPASERLAAWGRINLHVYKARRELAELGVESASALIERRRGQELLRFGGARAQIHDADGVLDGNLLV
ncbi:MAG: hypothetical protein RIT28_2953 [Pseudomonadota bacterium]